MMSCNTNNTSGVINVAISGVGGQGVLTLAEILARAAVIDSHNVRVGEIHGMAQRGGHVVCTVRIGQGAKGPVIDPGTADLLVGFEPSETLREVELVRSDGCVLMNSHIIYPVAVSMGKAKYPENNEILSNIRKFCTNVIEFDAFDLSKKAGSTRTMNMIMLGAILGSGITPITESAALSAIKSMFPVKFEAMNMSAYRLGYDWVHNALQK